MTAAGRVAGTGPEAHAGGIALALDWKPNPGSSGLGAFCGAFVEGKGEVQIGGSLF